MAGWKSTLREPLVQFLVIGAALVLADRALVQPEIQDDRTIEVSGFAKKELFDSWKARWAREPTAKEKQALIKEHVRDEVLYREALALGLDKDDTIIRRRLVQKMSFLLDSPGPIEEVSEKDLQSFAKRHPELFTGPATYDFRHIYFSADMRSTPKADAEATLKRLQPGSDGSRLGDDFAPGQAFRQQSDGNIRRIFGDEFTEALDKAVSGAWTGPIRSAYGFHLVRIDARSGPSLPPLSEIKPRVRELYLEEQRKAAARESYRRVSDKYRIVNVSEDGEAD